MNHDRSKQLHVRVSKEERAWLESIGAEQGITVSAAVRQLIRERWAKEFPERAAELKRDIGAP